MLGGEAWVSLRKWLSLHHLKPLSASERVFSQKEQLMLKYVFLGLGACICSLFGLYSPRLSAIRKTSQQVAEHSQCWRALPGSCSCVLGSRTHQSQLSPASADPEKNKPSVIAWRISPYTSAVARASPAKWRVAGCWDFVRLDPEQNHLLLLK